MYGCARSPGCSDCLPCEYKAFSADTTKMCDPECTCSMTEPCLANCDCRCCHDALPWIVPATPAAQDVHAWQYVNSAGDILATVNAGVCTGKQVAKVCAACPNGWTCSRCRSRQCYTHFAPCMHERTPYDGSIIGAAPADPDVTISACVHSVLECHLCPKRADFYCNQTPCATGSLHADALRLCRDCMPQPPTTTLAEWRSQNSRWTGAPAIFAAEKTGPPFVGITFGAPFCTRCPQPDSFSLRDVVFCPRCQEFTCLSHPCSHPCTQDPSCHRCRAALGGLVGLHGASDGRMFCMPCSLVSLQDADAILSRKQSAKLTEIAAFAADANDQDRCTTRLLKTSADGTTAPRIWAIVKHVCGPRMMDIVHDIASTIDCDKLAGDVKGTRVQTERVVPLPGKSSDPLAPPMGKLHNMVEAPKARGFFKSIFSSTPPAAPAAVTAEHIEADVDRMPGATAAPPGLDPLYGAALDTAAFGRDSRVYSPLADLRVGVAPEPRGQKRYHRCGLGPDSLLAAVSVACALITDIDDGRFSNRFMELQSAVKFANMTGPAGPAVAAVAEMLGVRIRVFTDDDTRDYGVGLMICVSLQDSNRYALMSFDNTALFGDTMHGKVFAPIFTDRVSPACQTFTDVRTGGDATSRLAAIARRCNIVRAMAPDVLAALAAHPYPWTNACIGLLRALYDAVPAPTAIEALLANPPAADTRRRTLALRIVEMKRKIAVMLAAAIRDAGNRADVLFAVKLCSSLRGGVPPWPLCGPCAAVPLSDTHYDPSNDFRAWCRRDPRFTASDRGITATGVPYTSHTPVAFSCGFPECNKCAHFPNADPGTPSVRNAPL